MSFETYGSYRPETFRIWIWNQNCTLAGQRYWPGNYQYDGEHAGEIGDATLYEGTRYDLIELSERMERSAGPGSNGLYTLRCAETLREAVE